MSLYCDVALPVPLDRAFTYELGELEAEVGARVMVNGREVPVVGTDGEFHYFTPPLATGESTITITAQNARGGVNTLQKKVVIQ